MPESGAIRQIPLEDETKRYLQSHPAVADRLRRAEQFYRVFGEYLRLTQGRVIVRESGGSTADVDLNATLSRANC